MKANFPADIVPFIEFLRSIREVQDICMKEELDWSVEYKEKIDKFEMNRKYLYEVFGLNQTLKMHVIKEHYVTYFKMTGKTLREVSAEYHEGVHHTHKTTKESVAFIKRRDWAVLHTLREAKQAPYSLMSFMLALQRAVICSSESQTNKK